ncbi:MAG: DUF447 family protein [Candidatus Thermoplasmatota archaeon]|nr:DUF447 family protein [Candidatus Thermoplasmatota archaeon]
MAYYEGILTSTNHLINSAAIGAEIKEDKIVCEIYRPSDTARNLDENKRFTFSLTADPTLFFKGSLTGHNDPDYEEIGEEELKKEEDFFYPVNSTKTYFCRVKDIDEKKVRDEYGGSELKKVTAPIIEEKGEKNNYIGRKNPLVDAMVHATRIYVADERQKKKIREKVREILKDNESELKKKILEFIEARC